MNPKNRKILLWLDNTYPPNPLTLFAKIKENAGLFKTQARHRKGDGLYVIRCIINESLLDSPVAESFLLWAYPGPCLLQWLIL